MPKKQKVIVALSGGVDSSVTCALLKEQGFEVEAVFMKNWTPQSEAEGILMCPLKADEKDARLVASQLGIKLSVVSFENEYRRDVVEYLFKEYKEGRTPNPDVLCNSQIKFKVFLDKALKMGADYVATGHYVRKGQGTRNKGQELLKGLDNGKDQSYFLYQITQEQLSKCLFPIGEFQKSEVRIMAKKYGLATALKKDSQGICFVGEVEIKEFLKTRIKPKTGKIITTEGKEIGEHEGVWYYTIGQRRGIGVGGSPRFDNKAKNSLSRVAKEGTNLPKWARVEAGGIPFYVVDKDLKNNRLIVARGDKDDALFKQELIADEIHWITSSPRFLSRLGQSEADGEAGKKPKFPLKCKAKVRYRQVDQECTVKEIKSQLIVTFKDKQRAITPGQFVVFYKNDVCLGGGKIV